MFNLGWNKSLLPPEEIIRPPDWRPPTPPRVDLSLTPIIELAKQDATIQQVSYLFLQWLKICQNILKDFFKSHEFYMQTSYTIICRLPFGDLHIVVYPTFRILNVCNSVFVIFECHCN